MGSHNIHFCGDTRKICGYSIYLELYVNAGVARYFHVILIPFTFLLFCTRKLVHYMCISWTLFEALYRGVCRRRCVYEGWNLFFWFFMNRLSLTESIFFFFIISVLLKDPRAKLFLITAAVANTPVHEYYIYLTFILHKLTSRLIYKTWVNECSKYSDFTKKNPQSWTTTFPRYRKKTW